MLGSTHIRDNFSAKKYYLEEILSICDNKKEFKSLEKSLLLYFRNQTNKSENSSISGYKVTQGNLKFKEMKNDKNIRKT